MMEILNLRCMGKQWVEETGQGQWACLYSFLLHYFFSSTQIQKQRWAKWPLSAIGNDWSLFFFFFHEWDVFVLFFFPLRWRQVSIINREVMDWQVLGLKHDSVYKPVGWFLGLLIGSSSGTISGLWQFTGQWTHLPNSLFVLCCSEGSWSDRGLVWPMGHCLTAG